MSDSYSDEADLEAAIDAAGRRHHAAMLALRADEEEYREPYVAWDAVSAGRGTVNV